MTQARVQHSLTVLWRSEATAWLVGDYLLMPDHVHLFCAPRDWQFGIDEWVRFWKSQFSRRHMNETWEFQRRSFHHRLRSAEEWSAKWRYVQENPLRAGLMKTDETWPYCGTVHELRW